MEGWNWDEALDESNTTFEFGPSLGTTGSAIVLQVGSMLALVVVAAAIARLVSAWYVGNDLTTGELLRGTLPIAWALLASCVLVHLLEAVSILGLGVLPLAVMTWFLVTAPVIGAERVGPIARHAPLGAAREPPVLERARRRPARLPRRAPLRLRHRAGAAGRVALPRHRGHRAG